MPAASIVIPAYNAEAFIETTLKSILQQTFQDFECLVIDDGSTDSTAALVKAFTDQRIQYIPIPNSGGPARPRNIGLQRARGDFIFLFDADDVMHPRKLELSIAAFQQYPQADFLFTNYRSIDEKDKLLKENYLVEYQSLWSLVQNASENPACMIQSDELYPALVKVNFIGTSSVALRRQSLSAHDRFAEQLRNSDDRLFMVNFAKNHHGIFIRECLHSYRVCKAGISNRDFSDRGVCKIAALKLMHDACPDEKLKKHLDQQIARDYAVISYAYKAKGLVQQQYDNAINSMKYQFNVWAIKLAAHALLFMLINRVSGKQNDG